MLGLDSDHAQSLILQSFEVDDLTFGDSYYENEKQNVSSLSTPTLKSGKSFQQQFQTRAEGHSLC